MPGFNNLFRNRNYRALIIFIIFYIGYGALLTVKQESIIYQPGNQQIAFADCLELPSAERSSIGSTRFYHGQLGYESLVVVYHGNAGRACDRAFLANYISGLGFDYLLVEYTGYAADGLLSSHETFRSDVENAVDYVSTLPYDRVVVLGKSLGVSAAALHTSLLPPQGLILISAYPDFPSVARHTYWFYPTSRLVRSPFPISELLHDFDSPVLMIHAADDRLIPIKLGRQLAENLQNVSFVAITGRGHNDLFSAPETYEALADFLVDTPDRAE